MLDRPSWLNPFAVMLMNLSFYQTACHRKEHHIASWPSILSRKMQVLGHGGQENLVARRKRLTPQQKKLVRAVVLEPNASLSDLGVKAGYSSPQHVHRALKAPGVVSAREKVQGLMEEREKLSLGALLSKIEDGLEATEIRGVKLDGTDIKVSTEVKDFYARHKYLETALELHGAINEKTNVAPSGPINVAIILAGGGSDAEKAAVADALVASRLARGLHPEENRKLTEHEASQYRRAP